ncbi:MAG: hypothetical protein ACYC36_02570 [Bellilinea sp.]
MNSIPQPRIKYGFEAMKIDEVKRVPITANDPDAGIRARCAAYAYGRRNGQQFCGAVMNYNDEPVMAIRRIK